MAFRTPPEVLLRQCLRSKNTVSQLHISPSSNLSCPKRGYRAAFITELGKPLSIQTVTTQTQLKPTEVLISNHAAGINFADLLVAKGQYQEKLEPPFVPGSELAGKVLEVGEKVRNVKVGDRVFATTQQGGAFAEYCVVNSKNVLPVPDNLRLVEAAATIVSYCTAMMALTRKAKLKQGEKVLVTAAAGATGLAVVDIAKNVFNCQVFGVCGGEQKSHFLKERGVDHTIDYKVESIRDRVKEITGGKGVDVAVDQVGGDSLLDCVKSLGFEGRALTVGYASGGIPKIPANQLLLKSSSLIGVFWGSYAKLHPEAFGESITQVLQAVSQGKINPYVGRTFALEEINDAFQCISDRRNVGKVVIKMREEEAST